MADCFMQMDQILGESADAEFKEAIMVTGWRWGVNWRSEFAAGGKSAGKGDVQHFCFSHVIDSASPALMARCVAGKEIPHATLSVRRAGGEAQLFARIRFEKVRLVSVEVVQGGGNDVLPVETVTFSFQRVNYEYAAQAARGSQRGGWVPFSWSAA